MLNKYRYQNKMRYNIKKNNLVLSWEKNKNGLLSLNSNNKHKLQYKKKNNWNGSIFWKHQDVNNILYKSACKSYNELTNNFWNEKKNVYDWVYIPRSFYKKKLFWTRITNRKNFIENVLNCIQNKDSLYYIRNSLYYLLDEKVGLNKIFDVLNFAWLYISKDEKKNYQLIESFNSLALKFIYKGFLKKGNKRKSEVKFMELLKKLKLKLKKASLHIMHFFIIHLKPLIGFRRKRIGSRKKNKKKESRFFFKLYGHNWRWQGLLIKRMIFNSPYYQKRTQYPSVMDLFKSLILSLRMRGPISKCLAMYYSIIGRRTPYAKRQKKKKKRKSKFIRI